MGLLFFTSFLHIKIHISNIYEYICDILKLNLNLLFQIKCSLYHLKPNPKKNFIFHAIYLSFRLMRSKIKKKTLNNKKLRCGCKQLEKTDQSKEIKEMIQDCKSVGAKGF